MTFDVAFEDLEVITVKGTLIGVVLWLRLFLTLVLFKSVKLVKLTTYVIVGFTTF